MSRPMGWGPGVLGVSALLLAAGVAMAEDVASPGGPSADAGTSVRDALSLADHRVGDWWILETRESLLVTADPDQGDPVLILFSVIDRKGDRLTLERRERHLSKVLGASDRPVSQVELPATQGALSALLGTIVERVRLPFAAGRVEGAAPYETSSGRVACRKVVLVAEAEGTKGEARCWLRSEVKGGLQALELELAQRLEMCDHGPDGEPHDTRIETITTRHRWQLVGYGTAQATSWGDNVESLTTRFLRGTTGAGTIQLRGADAPVHPFGSAQPGDWASYRLTTRKPDERAGADGKAGILRITEARGCSIYAVAGGRIGLRSREISGGRSGPQRRDSAKLDSLLTHAGVSPGFEFKGMAVAVEVTDDVREVAGRALPCKMVVVRQRTADGGRTRCVTLWLSAEIKATGIVAAREVLSVWGRECLWMQSELVGHGTANETLFGVTYEALKDSIVDKLTGSSGLVLEIEPPAGEPAPPGPESGR